MNLLDFVAKLATIEKDMQAAAEQTVVRGSKLIAKKAKAQMGHEQPYWPALKPETIARKRRGNTPLLETGELRDSIEWTVPIRENATTVSGYVGSNNPKAEWHEFGTSRVPPRPFLGPAAMGAEKELHAIAQREVAKAFAGGKHYHELREIFHAAEKAWHATKELVESIGEDEDEK